MRLSTARDQFIAYKRDQSCTPSTLRAYHGHLKLFIDHVVHETGRDATLHFTGAMIRSFFAHCDARKSDITRKTLACYQTTLREFTKWGLRKRYWSEDPLLDMPTIKYAKGLPRPFATDELERLMAVALTGTDEVLRAVLYYTGARDAEICGIRLCDLRPPVSASGVARVSILGKGRKERVVSVPPVCWALMAGLMRQRAAIEKDPEAPLLSQRDGSPWSPRMIQRRVRQWGVTAEVHDCAPHRFRHTFATNLLDEGEDIRVIKDALGHASLATTEIYTKVSDRRLDAAALRLRTFPRTSSLDSQTPCDLPGDTPGKYAP